MIEDFASPPCQSLRDHEDGVARRGAGRGDHRWVVHIALVYGNRWDLIMPG